MAMSIALDLTKQQQEAVKELIEHARVECAAGRPGMVCGQVFFDRMHVGYLPNEKALTLAVRDSNGEPVKI